MDRMSDFLLNVAMNQAKQSYGKILEITKEIELNLDKLGLNYRVHFSVEDKVGFNFISKNGVLVESIKVQYEALKGMDSCDIVSSAISALVYRLLSWKDFIDTLQP